MYKLAGFAFVFFLLFIVCGCVSRYTVEERCNLNEAEEELFQSFKGIKYGVDWSFVQLNCFGRENTLKRADIYSFNGDLYRPELVDSFINQCKSKANDIINLAKKVNGCHPPEDMSLDYGYKSFANVDQSVPQVERYMDKLVGNAKKYKEAAKINRERFLEIEERKKKEALRKAELMSLTEQTTLDLKISISEAKIFYSMFILEMVVTNITKTKIVDIDKFIKSISYTNSEGGEDLAFFPRWSLSDNFGNVLKPNLISSMKTPKSQLGPSEKATLYSSYKVVPIKDSKLKISFDKDIFGELVVLEIPSRLVNEVSEL